MGQVSGDKETIGRFYLAQNVKKDRVLLSKALLPVISLPIGIKVPGKTTPPM